MAASGPGDPQRDKLLSRLLAESLAASVANGGACPDAETIAAYAERGLTVEQAAQLDTHFAGCQRCQKALAALAVSLEALPEAITAQLPELPTLATIPPMNIRPNIRKSTQANIERSGQSLHPARATAASSAPVLPLRTVPRGQPTRWRQLAPALGIAAAVALWFALRPAPLPQTLSAQLEAQKEISAAQIPRAGNDSEIAEGNIPAPPSPGRAPVATAAPAPPSSRESQQLSADASPGDTLRRFAAPRDDLKKTESAENSPSPESNSIAGSPAVAAEPEKRAQAKASATTAQSEASESGALSAAAPSVAPAAAPSAAPAPPAAGVAGFGGEGNVTANATANVAPRAQVFALRAAQVPVFASPSRAVMWRVGVAGGIERSADHGQTWEKQASGVLSDLVAGAATSNDAAWVVGRAGVILRTTDGAHWQRVSLPAVAANSATMRSATVQSATANSTSSANVSPAAAPPATTSSAVASSGAASGAALDLSGVEARDALHATVIAVGGRRFITSDGGQTWTAQ